MDAGGPEIDEIRRRAEIYLDKFPKSRMKMPDKEPWQIQELLDKIYEVEQQGFENGIKSLGLNLITFDDFAEIPEIFK